MDKYVVTPSINVEGANDSASHLRRVPAVSGGADGDVVFVSRRASGEDEARRSTLTAHAVSSAATIAYAIFQIAV